MPFTPFHWGLPIIVGEFFFKDDFRKSRVQFVGLLAATLPDLEGFANRVLGISSIEVHGPLHSLLGCLLIGGLLLGFTMYMHGKYRDEMVSEDDFLPRYFHPNLTIGEKFLYILSPLLYQLSLDIFLYSDIELFWPIQSTNPVASAVTSEMVTNFAVFTILVAIFIFIWNIIKNLLKYIDLGQYPDN